MEFSLKEKVALITGASRGIGEATAIGLARAGADLAIVSRKLQDLEKVAEEVKKLGKKCLPVQAHLGKLEEINQLVKRVLEEFGKIDILVNNAATNPTMAQAIDADERAWDSVMNLNLKGLFFLSRRFAEELRLQRHGFVRRKILVWIRDHLDRLEAVLRVQSGTPALVHLARHRRIIAKSPETPFDSTIGRDSDRRSQAAAFPRQGELGRKVFARRGRIMSP